MADKKHFVSVIIPNYNHARYLDQRIQSVLNQTYQNFEVIILDDKSTDNSVEVIEKYRSNEHVTQVVINEENSGSTFKQWEKGFALAKGDLIWIAESDDFCDTQMLKVLVEHFERCENCSFAYCSVMIVNEDGEYIGRKVDKGSEKFNGIDFIERRLLYANFVLNVSCAIFRKEYCLSIPNEYKTYKGAGDYLFWVEMALLGNVAVVNKQLSFFRRHIGTVTSLKTNDGTNSIEENRIVNYIIKRIPDLSKSQISRAYEYRILRLISQNPDNLSPKVIERLLRVWNVNKFVLHINTPGSIALAVAEANMAIRINRSMLENCLQEQKYFTGIYFLPIFQKSYVLFIFFMLKEFFLVGKQITKEDYNYVCRVGGVSNIPFLCYVDKIRVKIGSVINKHK